MCDLDRHSVKGPGVDATYHVPSAEAPVSDQTKQEQSLYEQQRNGWPTYDHWSSYVQEDKTS